MNKFAKALALFGTGSFIGTIAQVLKGKLGAIFLGVDGIGILNQLTNAWGLLYTISGLGFYSGIVQRISRAHVEDDVETIKRQFVSSLIFLTAFSLISTTVAVALSAWISNLLFGDNGQRYWLVALILCSVPVSVVAQIYVGLFSGCKLVRYIVGAQVITDLTGTAVFAVLISYKYLVGAVVAFGVSNITKLVIQIYLVNKHFAPYGLHRWPIRFHAAEIKVNLGYGASGFLLVSAAALTTMIVSRWIIVDVGVHANGLFSASWKVCTLYFGALYATASGYYFPILAASRNSSELSDQVLEAITLYMYIMAPLAIGLITSGETLMRVLFSDEFATAASLLLWFLPGDILRIFSETIALSFLAKKKLAIYSLAYLGWASLFLILSFWLIKAYGLIGVGYAYFTSHIVHAVVVFLFARFSFGFSVSREAAQSTGLALVAAGAAAAVASAGFSWRVQYSLGVFIATGWFILSWSNESFRAVSMSALNRIKGMLS